jgi:T5orf172 domain
MTYIIVFFVGIGIGALAVWLLMMSLFEQTKRREKEARLLIDRAKHDLETNRAEAARISQDLQALTQSKAEFREKIISYDELKGENSILKTDLQNIDVLTNKLELDRQIQQAETGRVAERSQSLASRYLNESVKAIVASLGSNNFTACKQRLLDVIARCREIGFQISEEQEDRLLSDLKSEFEKAVRAAFEREEQARIKAQIREEERLKREIDRELRQLDRERQAIQAALDRALAEAKGQHNAEIQQLQERLAEAEAKTRRTISMAELTKAGHIYVISNIGTLGRGIFKVGMTRRLEPRDRVYELSSASVPFPYDVHMMISTSNAPALENALHKALKRHRVNKANPRKEFFRASIEQIHEIVKQHHGEVSYQADPEALEYNQTLTMSDEDAALIENVYDTAEEDLGIEDGD